MTPLWGHSEIVASFVASLVGCEGFGPCQAMGVLDADGKLVAGVVYNNWRPEYGTIDVSGVAITPRWLTRAVLREAMDYPFRIGCQAVCFHVDPDNRSVRRGLRAVGGVEHEIPRLRGRDKSEILIVVTEEAWRGSKFGEELQNDGSIQRQDAAGAGAAAERGPAA